MKQTEVGWIPDDWDVTTLGHCGEVVIGLTYKPEDVATSGTLVLRSSNIKNTRLDFKDCVFVRVDLPERVKVRKNDLLICVRNGSKKLIGKCALITDAVAGQAFGAFMAVFRAPNNEYVFQVFQSGLIQRQIQNNLGATINQITNKDLKSYWIALPDSEEQKTIAEALSDADSWIESLALLIEKKRLIKHGAMQELMRPKAGWEVKRLGEIADQNIRWSFTGGPFGSNLKSSDYTSDGVRVIQLQNIGDGEFIGDSEVFTSFEKAEELVSCNIYPNEIILSKMGDPVARACIIPNDHDRYLMCSDGIRLAVNKRENDSYFICHYINSPYFRNQAENNSTGSTRKRIGLVTLRNLELIVPNGEEQSRIAKILVAMDSEIKSLEQTLSKARQIKQGMMQQLLTGKIRLVKPINVKATKTLNRVTA